ncbi:MAG: molybdenum cofactor guanylyltransferase [Pseudomonadota bacterium]
MDRQRILAAVLAGGQSRRFGSDKALAMLDGTTLLELALTQARQWSGAVVLVGREVPGIRCVPDWPRPAMGPLGGIAAALRLASSEGFDAVLTCGVDSPQLPADLLQLLAPAPAYVADQPVVGLWPARAADAAVAILAGSGKHSMLALAGAVGARAVALAAQTINVNRPDDLDRLRGAD